MYEYKCRIDRVVDGDTVDVDIDLGFGVWLRKERVRMYGIDTPESRTRDLEEKKYGLAAKAFVLAFLPVDSEQTLRTRKDGKGKFGRILGEFTVYDAKKDAWRSLNEVMIDEHHGVKYYGQSKQEIAEAHLENRKLVIL
tara:strand:+ start:390 stop:806 length:417 start_codon:yes stop_codon:yes gene_type:complete